MTLAKCLFLSAITKLWSLKQYHGCSDFDVGNHGSHLDKYLAAAVVGAASSDKSKINSISRFTLCFKSHLAEYQVPAYVRCTCCLPSEMLNTVSSFNWQLTTLV